LLDSLLQEKLEYEYVKHLKPAQKSVNQEK